MSGSQEKEITTVWSPSDDDRLLKPMFPTEAPAQREEEGRVWALRRVGGGERGGRIIPFNGAEDHAILVLRDPGAAV
jgi:hypothetical protein